MSSTLQVREVFLVGCVLPVTDIPSTESHGVKGRVPCLCDRASCAHRSATAIFEDLFH